MFLILFLALVLVSGSPRASFERFVQSYNKTYATAEEREYRFAVYQNSIRRVKELNRDSKHAKFALNKFADLTPAEFSATMLMPKRSAQVLAQSCLASGVDSPLAYTPEEINALPTAWDWRTTGGKDNKGIVTPVKNQGQCGSCWTFSTTGNIESLWAKKGNTLTEFSEQLIVDCSHGCCSVPGEGSVCNQGCNGGFQWNAFQDIVSWGGLQTESEYPYTAETGVCHMDKQQLMAPITGFKCLSGPKPANEDQLQAYIYENGPVSIAMDAGLLQFYFGGIVDPFYPNLECDPNSLDHALLIVGWGQEANWVGTMTPYWLVKNSWGADWGDSGYFLIARNMNLCGLANAVSAATM